MNVEMIRQNYGKVQITLPIMTGREFRYLMDSLDYARYEDPCTKDASTDSEVIK